MHGLPPIVIVGNPRSGTTFLHRFLISQKLGTGSQLWQLIYPSVVVQKIIKPILPVLEYISPAKHHSTEAHKTSLSSVETDDVSLLFRFLDGFFLALMVLGGTSIPISPVTSRLESSAFSECFECFHCIISIHTCSPLILPNFGFNGRH